MTTRGMGEGEAAELAQLMLRALRLKDDVGEKQAVQAEVRALCESFPVPKTFS
jgi:glycine/serine hydroxymethyltransferase